MTSAELSRARLLLGEEEVVEKKEKISLKKTQREFLSKRALKKRTEEFDKDYPTLLISLAAGIKTGLDPMVALSRSGELFGEESVMREEIARFSKSLDDGETEEVAIKRFGAGVNHPDVKLFHIAFLLSRREGSSIAVCLQRLAKVTRLRQSFRRKVRAAVAMQKLSAMGITGCAVLIGLIQVVSNADAFFYALSVPLGQIMLGISSLLLITGIIWMFRMTKFRI